MLARLHLVGDEKLDQARGVNLDGQLVLEPPRHEVEALGRAEHHRGVVLTYIGIVAAVTIGSLGRERESEVCAACELHAGTDEGLRRAQAEADEALREGSCSRARRR